MSNQGHRGWWRLPSYRIITVSRTFMCRKCTLISVLVKDLPLYPSTGHSCVPAEVGNDIQYVWDSPPGGLGGRGLQLISPSCIHSILGLTMHDQQPCRNVLTTVQTLYSYPLSFPVHWSLRCHPSLIRCLRMGPSCPAETADHSDSLLGVFPNSNSVKQPVQGFKRPLQIDQFLSMQPGHHPYRNGGMIICYIRN